MDRATIRSLAKVIWDFSVVNQPLQKADCIVVLGSNDTRVAEYGATLFLNGWASLLLFSGKSGSLTHHWSESEAALFAAIALKMGVPKTAILIEDRASNTGENIIFSHELLQKEHVNAQKVIFVQKPSMGKRTFATVEKLWPEVEAIITGPTISFEDYPNNEISEDDMINVVVGDLQRLRLYSDKGFQTTQYIPEVVWNAYEQLVAAGYTKRLVT